MRQILIVTQFVPSFLFLNIQFTCRLFLLKIYKVLKHYNNTNLFEMVYNLFFNLVCIGIVCILL
jgi:hypothetical protein